MSKNNNVKNPHTGIPDLLPLPIRPLLMFELKSFSKKKRRQCSSYSTNIPSRVKEEVRKYVYSYETQAVINRF